MSRGSLAVLITGAGAPGTRGTIYALRWNCDRQRVRIIGVDAQPNGVGRYLVERFYKVPSPEESSYIDELMRICCEECIQVVIPQTSREINVLSKEKQRLLCSGIQSMVSDWSAIEIANSKWRLLQEFERVGLPVPSYSLARSEQELTAAVHALGYPGKPVVVKPPFSNGMRGVRVLKEDAWNVQRFLSEKPSGLEISFDELLGILRRGDTWPELLVTEYARPMPPVASTIAFAPNRTKRPRSRS